MKFAPFGLAILKVRLGQVGVAEVRRMKTSQRQVSSSEVGPSDFSVDELGERHIRARDVSSLEVGFWFLVPGSQFPIPTFLLAGRSAACYHAAESRTLAPSGAQGGLS